MTKIEMEKGRYFETKRQSVSIGSVDIWYDQVRLKLGILIKTGNKKLELQSQLGHTQKASALSHI